MRPVCGAVGDSTERDDRGTTQVLTVFTLRYVEVRVEHRPEHTEALQDLGWYVRAEGCSLLVALISEGGRVDRPIVRADESRQAETKVSHPARTKSVSPDF